MVNSSAKLTNGRYERTVGPDAASLSRLPAGGNSLSP